MKLDVDNKQRLMTFLFMGLEFYKVIMGTFLVIFVPQKCEDGVCNMTDNFFNGTILNSAGNICNFVTFTSVGTLYFIELKRENWCIKYLDIDDSVSTNNLDEEIERYPEYKKQMKKLNVYYIRAIYISLLMMVMNFIVSGLSVYQSYAGTNTTTTFISFFLLVSMKLFSAWNVGSLSIKDERANSAYLKEPKTYNTIDEDFKIENDIEESKINILNI